MRFGLQFVIAGDERMLLCFHQRVYRGINLAHQRPALIGVQKLNRGNPVLCVSEFYCLVKKPQPVTGQNFQCGNVLMTLRRPVGGCLAEPIERAIHLYSGEQTCVLMRHVIRLDQFACLLFRILQRKSDVG